MRPAAPILALLLLAALASAQDGTTAPPAPAAPAGGETTTAEPAPPEPVTFGDDLGAAREEARQNGRPLLVVAVPDWYESPAWARIEKDVLADAGRTASLRDFVRVLVKETRDREVHVRHRVPFAGYPLAVVLSPEGTYLGHTSGLPAAEDASWTAAIAAIPPRAKRIAELRTRLDSAPEDPDVLFELGRALSDAGESERADALFERMERADPLAPADRLGEARYHRLRHRVVDLLAEKRFGDVEALCLRWRRRFAEHARAPEVLLLQANAQFLAGQKAEAIALWERIEKDHADTDAAKRAKKAREALKD